jgi:acetolactate synthase-1/2/3 large subunit
MGGFQDASGAALDDCAALRPVTGLSLGLSSRAVVPHHLRHAITHVMTDRAPAHLSIPVDVQRAEIEVPVEPVADALLRPQTIDEDAIAHVVETLHRPGNERIVLLAGAGVLHADGVDALRAFAERFDVPVATTLAGRGVFPEDHPLALGVFGYGGSRWAIDAIRSPDVDVLMIVGSGLSQRDTMQWDPSMLPAQALIHIDADPMLIGRTWASEIPVVSNPAVALQRLATMEASAGLDAGRDARRAFVAGIEASGPNQYGGEDTRSDAVPMHPARVVAELRAAFPNDGVLCVDSGAHRAWFAEYWTVHEPGTHYSLTNLGPMGGAVPLGIGAKLARPERPLMVATGDGCMLMHGMELHTAARERIPLIVAVMDNHSYGNIWFRAAELGPGPERLTDIAGVDWVGFARSMGADGERVEEPGAIAAAVERGLAAPGPYLLDLVTDKTYPTPVAAWRERVHSWHDDD